MADDVRKLLIQIDANAALLQTNIRKAERELDRMEKSATKTTSKVSGAFSRMNGASAGVAGGIGKVSAALGVLGAGLSVSMFMQQAGQALEYASSLGEVAQQMGVTTDTLQEYRYIASQVGIDQETMDKGLQRLTRSIGQASQGNKSLVEAFGALHVAYQTTDGQTRNTGDVMRDLVAAISAIEDPAKRAAAEVAIFGKSGQALDTLLAGGVEQADRLRQAAHDLGIVLSEDVIAKADDAADKISELKQVMGAQLANVVAENASAFVALGEAIAGAVGWMGSLISRVQQYNRNAEIARSNSGDESMFGIPGLFEVRRKGANLPDRVVTESASDYAGGLFRTKRVKRYPNYARVRGGSHSGLTQPDYVAPPSMDRVAAEADNDYSFSVPDKPRKTRAKSDKASEIERAAKAQAELNQRLNEAIEAQKKELVYIELQAIGEDDLADTLRDQNGMREQFKGASEDQIEQLAMLIELEHDRKTEIEAQVKAESELQDRVRARAAQAKRDLEDQYAEQEQQLRDLSDLFYDAFSGGSGSIWKQFESMGLRVISNLAAQWASGMASGEGSGGIGGMFQTALASAFGGGFADGGNPPVGKISMVGERGPELFVPKQAGTIIPNHALGGRSVTQIFQVNAQGAVMASELMDEMRAVGASAAQQGAALAQVQAGENSRRRLGRTWG